MRKLISVVTPILILTLAATVSAGDSRQLVTNLKAGKRQTVVAYGTSLTDWGPWVGQLQKVLNAKYPGLATVINSGQCAMWSKWGVDNLAARVLAKKPDTVFIEFAANDAYLEYKTSVAQARANLINMIDRILAAKADTEIILMVMNPPVDIHLQRRPKYKDYYQMYRDVAKERKLLLVDHCPNWERVLKTDRKLFDTYVPDGAHPGPEGCEKVITPAILKALGIHTDPATPGSAK